MSISRGAIERTSAADRVSVSALIGIGVASTLLYALGMSARYPLAVGLRSVRAGWSTLVDRSLKIGVEFAGVDLLLIVAYIVRYRLRCCWMSGAVMHCAKQGWTSCACRSMR